MKLKNFQIMDVKVELILKKLINNGYEAYIVGGSIRDYLLNIKSYDYDIVTNTPLEIQKKILADIGKINWVGKNFGVLIISGIEVATYRQEKYENNGDGKPIVSGVSSLSEDSNRRDFTCNSLYLNLNGEVIDFHNGLQDIKLGIIRAINNPDRRFKEDASRILRAIYLAVKLKFQIEKETLEAMKKNWDLLKNIPIELQQKIFQKIIKTQNITYFYETLVNTKLLRFVFPYLKEEENSLISDIKFSFLQTIQMQKDNKQFILSLLIFNWENFLKGKSKKDDYSIYKTFISLLCPSKKEQKEVLVNLKAIDDFEILFSKKGNNIEKEINNFLKIYSIKVENIEELKNLITNLIKLYNYLENNKIINNKKEKFEINNIEEISNFQLDKYYYFIKDLPITGKDILEYTNLKGEKIGEKLKSYLYKSKQTREEIINNL